MYNRLNWAGSRPYLPWWRRPLDVLLVRNGPVLYLGDEPAPASPPEVAGDSLAAVHDLDRGGCQAYVDALLHQL